MDVDAPDSSSQTPNSASGAEGRDETITSEIMDQEAQPVEDQIKSNMISRIAMSDAHFKHQQRGEPDLTIDEKAAIANEILCRSPSMFLSRFKQFLTTDDLEYFKELRGDYEIDFYLKEISKQQDAVHSQKLVKNRRYAAMQELMMKGDYFSDDEMKWRDPLLYEQMVGNYLTDEEIQSKVDKTDLRFSNILLKHMDQLEENALYAQQKEAEECQEEEEDEESEEEEEMSGEDFDEEKKPKISDIEKQMLKAEFLQIMQERFISGKDEDFDYSEVDRNINYDSLDTIGKDEEEKYFDGEEPRSVDSSSWAMDSPRMVDSPRVVAINTGDTRTENGEEVEDYMNFEAGPDVTTATSEFHKMSVAKSSLEEETSDKG